jgi:hypothetical protein
LEAGADYQLYRERRPTELVAKYAFETTSGSRVYVENRGMRMADPETSERLRDGKPVAPEDVYFCSVPEFETADPDLSWLTENVFVAAGTRQPNGVRLAVYNVKQVNNYSLKLNSGIICLNAYYSSMAPEQTGPNTPVKTA